MPKFLIATLHENLATGGSIKFATLVIAAWCYYSDKQINQNGQPLEIIDVMQGKLHDAAKETAKNTLTFIQLESLFGRLSENERFTTIYTSMLQELYASRDIKKLMQSLL